MVGFDQKPVHTFVRINPSWELLLPDFGVSLAQCEQRLSPQKDQRQGKGGLSQLTIVHRLEKTQQLLVLKDYFETDEKSVVADVDHFGYGDDRCLL